MTSSKFKEFDHHAPGAREGAEDLWTDLRSTPGLPHSDKLGGFYLAGRYADLKTAFMDFETYSSAQGITLPVQQIRTPHIPPETDPPIQRDYRKILQPFVLPAVVREREPQVRTIARNILDTFKNETRIDFFKVFARPFPVHAALTLFGLPPEDGPYLDGLVMNLHEEIATNVRTGATDKLTAYVEEALKTRIATVTAPPEDMVSAIALGEAGGKPMTLDEKVSMLRLLLIGGFDTTAITLATAAWWFAEHPEDFERIRANPDLIDGAAEEFVRLASPASYLRRTLTRDAELGGEKMKKGDRVLLSLGAANRDPSVFERPDEAVIDRKPNPHIGFGLGVHRCIGAPFAKLEIRMAFEEILQRYDRLEVDPDKPIKLSKGNNQGIVSLPLILTPKKK